MRRLVLCAVAATAASACILFQASRPPPPPPPYERVPGAIMVGATSADGALGEQGEALASFIQQATGRPAKAAAFATYDALAEALADGKLDVAFMSPLAYVRAEARGKVQPLLRAVRNGRTTYRAVLFSKKGGRVKDLQSLRSEKDLKVAWVDPDSATGYVYPKAFLLQVRINPVAIFVSQDFLGSHDAVCHAVDEGQVDVGATFTHDPPSQLAPKHVDGCSTALRERVAELHVVAATDEVPNDVLAVRPEFPQDLKARIVQAAGGLITTRAGLKTLATAFQSDGLAPSTAVDYAPVRKTLESFGAR